MIRIYLCLIAALFSVLDAPPLISQAVAQVTAPSQPLPNGSRVTAKYINVPLGDALRDVAVRGHVKINFTDEKLPVGMQVTHEFVNTTPDEAFSRLLRGTKLRAVLVATGDWVVTPVVPQRAAGQGVIVGKVIDAKTGKGISGATISLGSDTRGVVTGEDGGYRLTGVGAGSQIVLVRSVGYAKQSRQITVSEGATVTADFKMAPSANVLDQVVVTGTVVQTELRAVPNAITVITARQIEERGITKIDQLFRGDIPGLFAQNQGSNPDALLDEVTMFSRGVTALTVSVTPAASTNPIKTYVDGIELANPKYLSQIDPKSIERIEILTGPQASTIYGSNAINGVMQIFTKRGSTSRPQLALSLLSGFVQNNFSSALTPQHDYSASLSGIEGRLSYNAGGSWNYMGPWTPAKQLARTGGFGGARIDFPTPAGRMSADLSLRRTLTQSLQRGSAFQTLTSYEETGWYTKISSSGLAQPTTRTLTGQTLGITLSYVPASWWSHELGLGSDVSETEQRVTTRGYTAEFDTTLLLVQSHTDRRSIRYATTARIPVTSLTQLTVTMGADAWQNLTTSLSNFSAQTLTGTLTGTTTINRRPGHNTGGFFQTQLGLKDQLFFTYGLRMEKNPTIGDKVRTLPGRYGVAYTHELGFVTAKLRGSYGRSIRPPTPTLKDGQPTTNATLIALYGNYDNPVANPDLAPEHQQGGEGGLELYLGTRGSLVVTRYNQTVDRLITIVSGADSVRSLLPCPTTCNSSSTFRDADGHAYRYQQQYLNVGSIRNQGWELQGSMNVGPFTSRGTYSWTKSRVIGITPKYRALFTSTAQYQPGATFSYLPEHTWALGVTYARARSSVELDFTGMGRTRNSNDDFFFQSLNSSIRLLQNRFNLSNTGGYISFNTPYTLADINTSHRFTPKLEALLQVQNISDKYTNDYYAGYASLGRQVRFGVRIRTN